MIKAIYIKKSTLEFKDLFQSLGLKKDNGGRWYASSEFWFWTDNGFVEPAKKEDIAEYLN